MIKNFAFPFLSIHNTTCHYNYNYITILLCYLKLTN